MGRHFLLSVSHSSRAAFHLRWRIALVLLVTAFCHQQYLFLVSRQSLAAKYSPTTFDAGHNELQPKFSRPDDDDSDFQDEIIANREAWRILSHGWEGKVFAYKDSVIKTFTPGQSPFRNCAPGIENEKWPTEIAASLRLGGHDNNISNAGLSENSNANKNMNGFLPVRAYFKAAATPSLVPEWHLVTPLLKGGNLNTLAKKTLLETKLKTAKDVDAHFRPAFERLLGNMQHLHEARYCHDDIKPANIFVAEDTRWLLGDLGNLRHTSHPYHSSRIWINNDQLRDCRANDAMRLLKSYLQFVKAAASDKERFDDDFFTGKEPISRLFWKASTDARTISAAQIQKLSMKEYPEQPAMLQENNESTQIRGTFRRLTLHKAVNKSLETRMGEKLARWWGMVGIFGVPNKEVCGF
ncbi:hypothetical protein BDU57DRAFT_518654 [Ampelomyces quisqualis]|uniref:Protein kinase domain-containing protein n=1 Tax=Ampelomyces quisqualis TaxID=50730 RepID=A0A6A5QJN8_AMPQU|nr:hypothetical protein BDU57DRAFT_518654 [Ampelomyces quisqualis]